MKGKIRKAITEVLDRYDEGLITRIQRNSLTISLLVADMQNGEDELWKEAQSRVSIVSNN